MPRFTLPPLWALLVPAAAIAAVAIFVMSAPWMASNGGLAAWVQAVGSIGAILASSWFAVWVPERNRRMEQHRKADKRLTLNTRRAHAADQMRLGIAYEPDSYHVGFEIRVEVLAPRGAIIFRPASDEAGRTKGWLPAGRKHSDRLLRGMNDSRYRAEFFFDTEDAAVKNRIEIIVEVWTDVAPALLVRRRVWISPVD